MLWGVLLSFQFFFIVMSWIFFHTREYRMHTFLMQNELLTLIFSCLALVFSLLSYFFYRRSYRSSFQGNDSSGELRKSFANFQMSLFYSWFFADSLTLLGIISIMTNLPTWMMPSFCLSGFSLQAFYYPRTSKLFRSLHVQDDYNYERGIDKNDL